MNLKKYLVYMDDGTDVLKIAVPAKSKTAAEKFCEGNGEIITVKDITAETPISAEAVICALKERNFGEIEIDLIVRTLTLTGIAE